MSAFQTIPLERIRQTHRDIAPFIHRTPVLQNDYLSKLVTEKVGHDVEVFFKAEALQRCGAFKIRGAAANVTTALKEDPNLKGVVTWSTGNEGAAMAWIAKRLGLKAAICVSENTSPAKIANIKLSDGELVKADYNHAAMYKAIQQTIETKGYRAFLTESDDVALISGQATAAVEFIEDIPELDCLLAPTCTGSLVAGSCVAAKQMKPGVQVFAVAPKPTKLREAIQTRKALKHWGDENFVPTKCDALIDYPYEMPFQIMRELLDGAFDVADDDAARAMHLIWKHLHVTAELSSCSVFAAVLSDEFANVAREKSLHKIGIILSGGNANLAAPMPWTTAVNNTIMPSLIYINNYPGAECA